MGSVNKTTNYGLNQWQSNEYPQRTDFNSDNSIVDTAMKANADAAAAAIPKSIATASDQTLVSTSSGTWGVKTLSQFKTWLALAASDISNFAASVSATALTGLSTATNAVITASDTVLTALGKLQAQITAHFANFDGHVYYGTDTGTANTYAVTLSPVPLAYVDGMAICVKIANASTGASTLNVNSLGAKTILDSLGNAITSGGLKAGLIYTFRYNSTTSDFIQQGKGGGGNATAAQLLNGVTATVDSGQIMGTMINKVGTATTITPTTADQAIPQGYYGGIVADGKVKGDANLVTANILNGKTIFGVAGSVISGDPASTGSGTTTGDGHAIITGLTFTPAFIFVTVGASEFIFHNTYATNTAFKLNATGSYGITVSAGSFDLNEQSYYNTAFTYGAYK
jgi:hypothetical protein